MRSKKMHRNRAAALQDILAKYDVDLAVLGPTTHMRYLLGDVPLADERLCVLLAGKKLQIVVPSLNAASVSSIPGIDELGMDMLTWGDNDSPLPVLESALAAAGKVRKLAVDGAMRADFLIPILSYMSPDYIVSADPLMSELRIKKAPVEIDALQAAAQQADRAMQAAIDACTPGIAEQEVAWAAEQAFRTDGAQTVEFTLIAAGVNAAFPHHYSGRTKLEHGMGVIIDIGASLNGYKSDITRTVFLGRPPDEFKRAYDTVLRANERGREAVKPGVTADEVDNAARSIIIKTGYGTYFIHRTGHGVGLDVHEAPWIMKGNEMKLEPGMVFSIEPGVYLPGKFGIRIEDIVVATDTGVRVLTGYDHELIVKE